jgi:IS4 transposase
MLSKLNVERIARETKFYKAEPRKVTITNLMLGFFSMALIGKNEYSKWAEHIGILIGGTVSKVALWKRMNKGQVQCLQAILEETFKIKFYQQYLSSKNDIALFSPFGEVYLQDSTIISLPDELYEFYKGSISKGKQKSSIRVQAVYGLLSGTFKEFSLGSFTENDQGASGDIINLLNPGDLIIRDLGYFVLKVFKAIDSVKAFFLSRYRYGVNIYDAKTGEQIYLSEILSRDVVDIEVLLGASERLKCRLVAVKLPGHIAAERRRKAKNNRDKRLNHSKEYMESLSWSIFVTNIDEQICSPEKIIKAYRVRWHIEIIFKGWKSHLNIAALVPVPPKSNRNAEKYLELYKHRIDSVILLMLVFIVMFQVNIYTRLVFRILHKHKKLISLMKLCSYIASHKERVFAIETVDEIEGDIAYYATFEKRLKRKNHLEIYMDMFDYQIIN